MRTQGSFPSVHTRTPLARLTSTCPTGYYIHGSPGQMPGELFYFEDLAFHTKQMLPALGEEKESRLGEELDPSPKLIIGCVRTESFLSSSCKGVGQFGQLAVHRLFKPVMGNLWPSKYHWTPALRPSNCKRWWELEINNIWWAKGSTSLYFKHYRMACFGPGGQYRVGDHSDR